MFSDCPPLRKQKTKNGEMDGLRFHCIHTRKKGRKKRRQGMGASGSKIPTTFLQEWWEIITRMVLHHLGPTTNMVFLCSSHSMLNSGYPILDVLRQAAVFSRNSCHSMEHQTTEPCRAALHCIMDLFVPSMDT